jgi:DNA-binding beta-propeller fold protein YncE
MRLFRMNFCQTHRRLVQAGVAFTATALVAGCGNNYRSTIVAISSSGPAAQVTSYTVVVSSTSTAAAGNATIIDYSGDSIMATASIGPGPTAFTVSSGGSEGYTYNSDGTISQFPVSSSLQQKQVSSSTIPSTAQLVNLFSPASGLWAADLCGTDPSTAACPWDTNPLTMNYGAMDVLTGNPPDLIYNVPLAPTPVMLAAASSSSGRYFAISQGSNTDTANLKPGNVTSAVACNLSPSTVGVNGTVTGIETSNYATDPPIWVGQCPVYALGNTDGSRLFVLNRGSDTISVINTSENELDENCAATNQDGQKINCPVNGTLPLSLASLNATNAPPNCNFTADPTCGGMPSVAGPVYAEFNSAKNQLVVADYDGGTISVIDASLDEYGNDGPNFGTTYTIPVGKNPASVTVLYDGSRAYTANQADQTVSIVELSSYTVKKTLVGITGHPRTVVSTQNSTQGKVYVASPDSNILTVIRTDQDIVDTIISVVGNIVDVRVQTQNGVSGNVTDVSRVPGYGQPCNLPGTKYEDSLTACQATQ